MKSIYDGINEEIYSLQLSKEEKAFFSDYYSNAGLLNKNSQQYFYDHYASSFEHFMNNLIDLQKTTYNPTVLDLGCGVGTQSIILAKAGFKVISVDMCSKSLSILRNRLEHLDDSTKKNINIINCNAFELNNHIAQGTVDAVWSMFAFNMMLPTIDLLQELDQTLNNIALVCILDGNQNHIIPRLSIAKKRLGVCAPNILAEHLADLNFSQSQIKGVMAVPKILYQIPGAKMMNLFFRNFSLTSFSYMLTARRHK
jgi:SAM-dependent methyltransferase